MYWYKKHGIQFPSVSDRSKSSKFETWRSLPTPILAYSKLYYYYYYYIFYNIISSPGVGHV